MTEEQLEIAMIASIISSEKFTDIYYELSGIGYVGSHEQIAKWAYEFYQLHKDTNWEEVLEDPESHGFPKDILCWDDAIIWFATQKLTEIKNK